MFEIQLMNVFLYFSSENERIIVLSYEKPTLTQPYPFVMSKTTPEPHIEIAPFQNIGLAFSGGGFRAAGSPLAWKGNNIILTPGGLFIIRLLNGWIITKMGCMSLISMVTAIIIMLSI